MVNRHIAVLGAENDALRAALAAAIIQVGLAVTPCRQAAFAVAKMVTTDRLARQSGPQAFAWLPAGLLGCALGDKFFRQLPGLVEVRENLGQLDGIDLRPQAGIQLLSNFLAGNRQRKRRSKCKKQGKEQTHDGLPKKAMPGIIVAPWRAVKGC